MLLNLFGSSALRGEPGRLDSRVSVCEYGDQRRTSAAGFNHATWSSYALRGVVSMRELDHRPPGVDVDFTGSPSAEEGFEGFRAQIRRDLGAAATRGQAAWFFEMGTWYSRDDTWPALEEGGRIISSYRNVPTSPLLSPRNRQGIEIHNAEFVFEETLYHALHVSQG